ncbi:hypothetical protein GA0074696_3334 [Micromonospora purpureochromogenes]|uniref:Uncharacterized protein n=1 Tax=Micromonospora purpureochromogenes TaxID=47872 RepID=A0A1C4YFF2_9ACTN|nr:hypothetical protein [Micromonospora purpureochromogenes]SCF19424.1 hypothetical protein GA0074696_3334 [Micromonospora purpureochromogenes]
MTVLTIAERIVQELLRAKVALDDDELARRLDVQPRQTINQACRRLEQSRRVRRFVGPYGKIVNELRQGTVPAVPIVAQEVRLEPAAGDSAAQRHAEGVMLALLAERLGCSLQPRRFALEDGSRVEIDGTDENLSVLVEAWAHQGPPKSAQKHKVLADAFRLMFVASTLPTPPRLVLCLSDPAAAHHFTSARSWAATALRAFGVDVEVVELPAEVKAQVLAAQNRQYR